MTPDPARGRQGGYLPAVDGIRGFAVTTAILYHLTFLASLPGAPHVLRHLLPVAMGLEMFFVLSGAMITGMLVREFSRSDTISVRMFYVRRSRRLGPGLLLVLPCLLIAQAVMGAGPSAPLGPSWWLAVGAIVLSVGNWRMVATEQGLGWLGPLWTLGIEEQFYITWPLLLRSSLRRAVRRHVVLIVLGVMLLACVALTAYAQATVAWQHTYYMTPTQLTGLIMGCALGYEIGTNPEGWFARLLRSQLLAAAGVAIMVAVAIWMAHSMEMLARFGYLAFGVGACLLVGHCFVIGHGRSRVTAVLSWRPITAFGKLSYETYLIHVPVILAVRLAAPTMPVLAMIALDLAIIVALASFLFYCAEQPVRQLGWRVALGRLRDRLRGVHDARVDVPADPVAVGVSLPMRIPRSRGAELPEVSGVTS